MATSNRKDLFEIKAIVTETLPNMMYRAEVKEGPEQIVGKTVLCTLNGNMRRFNIRVLPGDWIIAEMSVYDIQRARVTRRLREAPVESETLVQPEDAAEQTAVIEETTETQTEET